jgi:catechol 2,3-dioxygenase-like lactoylglutathione lyase family enzyme
MPALSLNHYTIRPRDLEATKDFYVDIIGLTVGDRPPLGFPGYWLYAGDVPVVHLIFNRAGDIPIEDQPRNAPVKVTRLDHVAFSAEGLAEMKQTLATHRIPYSERVLPRLNMTQLFMVDPDGIDVEINFPPSETVP